MTRLSPRIALAALALAALSGATLAAGEASAKPFPGGFHGGGFHGHHGHFRGGFGFGVGVGYLGTTYVGIDDEPEVESCVVRRVVAYDGTIILKRRCF